jgi:phosphate transport system substrate-binding protein
MKTNIVAAAAVSALLALCGCGGGATATNENEGGVKLSGSIAADGSSTVAPITEAMAEEFGIANPGVRVTVGTSGTGGGFKKFLNKEMDISNASRPIKESELELATKNGVEYIELPVAFDGLTVVVNPANTWVDKLTIAELNKIWAADSKVKLWSEVRAGWPAEPIKLYGPGADSGTFDYFTDVVNGEEGVSRTDYSASEDDNVLVTGVAGDKNALGYFGYAYFEENADKLKAVPIVNEAGAPITPNPETIQDGSYAPLSRPLFIYVRKDVMDRPEVTAFVKYYLSAEATKLVSDVGYVPLPQELLAMSWKRYEAKTVGSIFGGEGSKSGMSLKDLLAQGGGH